MDLNLEKTQSGLYVPHAPALIRLGKKSLNGPGAESLCVKSSMQAHVGNDDPLPVVFDRKIIGYVQGYNNDNRVTFVPRPGFSMAGYTTYDDVIAGLTAGQRYPGYFAKAHTTAFSVANNHYDLWPVAGMPAAGTYAGAASTLVQFTDATLGALYLGGNVSTAIKSILGGWLSSSANTPTVTFYDRVATYEANVYNAAANHVMTNTLTAQRYVSTNQSGMKIMTTVQTVNGATAANLTQLRYTNQAGTTLQSVPTGTTLTFLPSGVAPTTALGARVILPITSGQTIPWGRYLPLAAGDGGVRLINDFTTSAANTGTFAFVLARELFTIGAAVAGVVSQCDGIFDYASLETVFDGACVAMIVTVPAVTALTLQGSLDVGWK